KAVVAAAQALDPTYKVRGQLPIKGAVKTYVAHNEADEAGFVLEQLDRLVASGHPDVEGPITPSRCAVLGRTRFALLAVESALRTARLDFYKQLSSNYESETDLLK